MGSIVFFATPYYGTQIYLSDKANAHQEKTPVGVVVSNPLEKKRERITIPPMDKENVELKKSLQRFEKTGKELREDLERLLEQSRRKEN